MLKIFVPAYNEEKNIEKNIKDIHKILTNKFNEFKLYVINDGSTDNTENILNNIKQKNFEAIKCNGPSRRENLVQSMVKYSKDGDIVGFMDADRSTDEDALDLIIKPLEENFDIVIGSRYVKGAIIKRTIKRRTISFFFNLFVKFYFNSKINDHECGFKFFKANVLKALVKDMGINNERKMFWDSEMLVRAQRKNYKILEIPVTWFEGPKSALSFKKELPMLKYMLKLRARL